MYLSLTTVIFLISVGFSQQGPSVDKFIKWPNQVNEGAWKNPLFSHIQKRKKEESKKNLLKNLEPFVGLSNAEKIQKCLTYQFSCNDLFWNDMKNLGGKSLERFLDTYEIRRQIGQKLSDNFDERRLKIRKKRSSLEKKITFLTLKNKRFFTEVLDKWIGIINLSGWRTAFFPVRLFYDFFGDKSKQDKNELERLIEEHQIEYERLKTNFKEMSEQHEMLKNEEEMNYNKLKIQYEKDLQTGLLGLNKKYRQAALEEICSHATVGRKFCLEHQ